MNGAVQFARQADTARAKREAIGARTRFEARVQVAPGRGFDSGRGEENRSIPPIERHTAKVPAKAFAGGFHKGLLQRPKVEEVGGSVRLQPCALGGAEHPGGKLKRQGPVAHGLHIHPDFVHGSHGPSRRPAGVGEAEGNGASMLAEELRLAILPGADVQVRRTRAKGRGQPTAQHSVGRHVGLSVLLETYPLGPGALLGRKIAREGGQGGFGNGGDVEPVRPCGPMAQAFRPLVLRQRIHAPSIAAPGSHSPQVPA